MKSTGVVRRIDDLGRIAIPKEIRRNLQIKEGDPLEIFTTREGQIIFQKYSSNNDVSDLITKLEKEIEYCGLDSWETQNALKELRNAIAEKI